MLQLTDRLEVSVSDMELLEILKRNLRPVIRKELLRFEITSLARLRQFVLRHELLDEELNKKKVHYIQYSQYF